MIKKISQESLWEDFDFYFADERVGRFSINWGTEVPSIWNVEIVKKYRGMGLGEQMMKECVDFLREDPTPKTTVFLYVRPDNIPAIKVYEKVGFTHTKIYRNSGPEKMEISL